VTSPAPLPAAAAVIGVDGCRAGWVGVHWSVDDTAAVLVAGTMLELVGGLVAAHGPVDVVGVDIPLHLPTDAPRAAEREARRRLPGRASTVFGSPSSAAIDAPDYAEANRLNREATGLGLSRQAFGLFPAIRDARAWLAGRPEVRVEEVHPESSFAELAGEPLLERKKTADGAARRRALLVEVGLTLPLVAPRGAGLDDLLDAGAAAWSARRVAQGTAVRLPEDPADGAPIWV
jgi:predicted RNase H-like nuclease